MPKRPFKKRGGSPRHEPELARDAVLVDYRVSGDVTVGQLDDLYDRLGYRSRLSDGLLAHVGGTLDEAIAYISIWRSEAQALRTWHDKRDDIEAVLASAGPDATATRHSHQVHRLIIGDDLEDFREGLAITDPECVGFVIDLPDADTTVYDRVIDHMDFPAEYPPGLLLHAAGQVGDVLRVTSVWRRADQSRRFFEDRLMPATVEVVRRHRVFPEIQPRELRVHLMAVSGTLLDG